MAVLRILGFKKMCAEASLLVHECTNGSIPERILRGEKGRLARVKGLEHSLVKKKELRTGEKIGEEPGIFKAKWEWERQGEDAGRPECIA